eukprot:11889231-Prorocentrum_lima.AAC.1
MTSSLVGSEMCIRDSVQLLLVVVPAYNRSGMYWVPVNAVALMVAPTTKGCLLYTSDAADDM